MKEKQWWRDAVVYQIYPRSFCDSDGDGIGDLNGITSKMDYLKDLGVDIIWLSPVYASPGVDNGYDISDYQGINPEFGTMEDFDRMLAAAHARGIRIVMDLVVNHTSDQHAWFQESRTGRDNPKSDYYIWKDPRPDGTPPNGWSSSFSGPVWTWEEARGQYYLHLFAKEQPDLNWENPAVRDAVYDMMSWWCEKGVDGFRMDVISLISKPQNLYDDGGEGIPCSNGPRIHEFLREMNDRVLSRYSLVTVGECPGVDVDQAAVYADPSGRELNMIFHFEHVSGSRLGESRYDKWDRPAMTLPELRETFSRWQYGLEGRGWNSLYLSNHDQPRCVSRFGCDSGEYRVLSAKMLATALHFQKGTPYVYQGEELGMTNAPMEDIGDYRDIESIRMYQFLTEQEGLPREKAMEYIMAVSRDHARTPMQWTAGENAGFTAGTPWIAVNPNYTEINAEAEMEDPDSVRQYYRELIRLRHTMDVMVEGRYDLLLPEDEQVFAYTRTLGDEKLWVFCNFTGRTAPLPEEYRGTLGRGAERLIGNYAEAAEDELRPFEAVVLLEKTGP